MYRIPEQLLTSLLEILAQLPVGKVGDVFYALKAVKPEPDEGEPQER